MDPTKHSSCFKAITMRSFLERVFDIILALILCSPWKLSGKENKNRRSTIWRHIHWNVKSSVTRFGKILPLCRSSHNSYKEHWELFLYNPPLPVAFIGADNAHGPSPQPTLGTYVLLTVEKTKIKEKEAGNGPSNNKTINCASSTFTMMCTLSN